MEKIKNIIKTENFPQGMEVKIVRSDGRVQKWRVSGNKDGVVTVAFGQGEGLITGKVEVDNLELWQKIPFETGEFVGPININGKEEKGWVFMSYDQERNQVGIAKVISPQENRTLTLDFDKFMAMIGKK